MRRRTLAGDLDIVTELAGLALDLNAVVQELFEGCAIKDTVRGRAGVVNDELVLGSSRFSGGGLGLHYRGKREKPSVSLLRRELSKAVLGTDHPDGGMETSGVSES